MKQLVFALQFTGTAGPAGEGKLHASTKAAGQALRASFGRGGIQAVLEPAAGDGATFESDVEIIGEGTFLESGTITYGSAGSVTFKTVGHGILGPSPMKDLQFGAVTWQVVSGQGSLAGATGYITSNFTVGAQGEVVDNQFAVLFVP
jgi:hypothetical protein